MLFSFYWTISCGSHWNLGTPSHMNLFFQRTAIQPNCCSSPEMLTHTVLGPSEKSLEAYESEVSLFFAIIVATQKLTNCNGSQFLSAFTKFREGPPLFPFSFSFFSFLCHQMMVWRGKDILPPMIQPSMVGLRWDLFKSLLTLELHLPLGII